MFEGTQEMTSRLGALIKSLFTLLVIAPLAGCIGGGGGDDNSSATGSGSGAMLMLAPLGNDPAMNASSSSAVSPSDCLFDWAGRTYRSQLAANVTPSSQIAGEYYYRYFPQSNSYLGISSVNQRLYFMSGANGLLIDLGPSAEWVKTASCQTPIAVLRSSYDNKIAAGKVIGSQKLPVCNESAYFQPCLHRASAFADFFQEGEYSLVNMTVDYDPTRPASEVRPGRVQFWKKENGAWIDRTSRLLGDNTGCLHASKAIVADFNGDKKSDVFFACSGYDSGSFPGEQQRILLSKPDGTYGNTTVAFNAFAHGGTAVDFDGSGFADIVLTDTSVRRQPFYLVNNRNGAFTEVSGKLPADTASKGIYSAEFIDVNADGRYDIWFGGIVNKTWTFPWSYNAAFFINSGSNNFVNAQKVSYPSSIDDVTALDVVVVGNIIYTLYYANDYRSIHVDKSGFGANTSTSIYTHRGELGATFMTWFPWIHLTSDQKLVSPESAFGVSIPLQ